MPPSYYTLPGQTVNVESRGEKMGRWLVRHRAQIGLAFAVLFISGAMGGLIVTNRKKLQEVGVLQLTAARFKAAQGDVAGAYANIEDVLRVQRTSPTAMQAFLLKGELLFQEKKFDEAEKTYKEGVLLASMNDYKALFLSGQAAAEVELKKYPEATAGFEKLIADFPDHFLVPRWYMEKGRLLSAQNQWPQAQAVYERFLTLYPKSPWAPEAKASLEFIKSKK